MRPTQKGFVLSEHILEETTDKTADVRPLPITAGKVTKTYPNCFH